MIEEPKNRFGRKSHETATAEELLASFAEAAGEMPQSSEAEEGIIASIFNDPHKLSEVRLKLQPQAFYNDSNRRIYEEMLTMDQEAVDIDPIVIVNRLRDQNALESCGGAARITELFCYHASAAAFQYYLKMMRDRWTLRKEIHGHLLAVSLCFRHHKDRPDMEVESTLNDCTSVVQLSRDGIKVDMNTSATLTQCLHEHVEHMQALQEKRETGKMPLITTGFPTLDKNAGGIAINEYWLVTGPTKAGKSILAGNIVKHAANKGWKCKIYTNEVQRVAYAGRFLASESNHFDGAIERHGFENRQQMAEYSRAVNTLSRTIGENVIIDNAAGKYVEDIVADIRMEAERGIQFFVVDLIGKLRTRVPSYSRENELAGISGKLSDATKLFNVALMVVAQENDDGAVRESKALAMDCEAWLKIKFVYKEAEGRKSFGAPAAEKKEIERDKRNLVVEVARGFSAGDSIPCHFNGARFLLAEMAR